MSTSISMNRCHAHAEEEAQNCEPCKVVRPASVYRKRLIVCCDGTYCAADQGAQNNATNVTRLSRTIANVGVDENNKAIMQIVKYQSGIGTGSLTMLNKDLQGALGQGLDEKVCEAYTFLVNNYGPGDEIFIFGFSRGAYTARQLASFICQVGLLSPGMMDYFYEIFQAYRTRDPIKEANFCDMDWAKQPVQPGELGLQTRDKSGITRYDWVRTWAHLHARIRVVGVFDTVGSMGMSGYVKQPGQDTEWYASNLHPKIDYAFHALALDEHRGNFSPTLFYLDDACKQAGVKLLQCWFPGYHANVGGEGAPKDDISSVDEITFAWMVDQLTHHNLLSINKRALGYPILDRVGTNFQVNGNHPKPPKSVQEAIERRITWSDGELVETNSLFWNLMAEMAVHRWDYVREPGRYRARDLVTGKEIGHEAFNETIHPCVWHRVQHRGYQPRALPKSQWQRQPVSGGPGFEWVMTAKDGHGHALPLCIPEYKIPVLEETPSEMEHWSGSLERRLAPSDYVKELDLVNGFSRGIPVRNDSAQPRPLDAKNTM